MGIIIFILKLILYIILFVVGIVVVVMLLPFNADVSFIGEEFKYKLKISFINIMDSNGGGIIGWFGKRRKNKKPRDYSHDDGFSDDDLDFDDIPEIEDIDDDDGEEPETAVSEPEKTEEKQSEETREEDEKSGKKEESTEEDKPEEEPGNKEIPEKKKPEKQKKNKDGKKTLGDKVEILLDLWKAAQRPVLRIFKGIKFSNVYIDFFIADEDAYKCALTYGAVSGFCYDLLAWMSVLFTVRFETVDIHPLFGRKNGRWDASFNISFRIGTMVIAGTAFLITYIFRYFIPDKIRNHKNKVR